MPAAAKLPTDVLALAFADSSSLSRIVTCLCGSISVRYSATDRPARPPPTMTTSLYWTRLDERRRLFGLDLDEEPLDPWGLSVADARTVAKDRSRPRPKIRRSWLTLSEFGIGVRAEVRGALAVSVRRKFLPLTGRNAFECLIRSKPIISQQVAIRTRLASIFT